MSGPLDRVESLARQHLPNGARVVGRALAENPEARVRVLMGVRKVPFRIPRVLLMRYFSNVLAAEFPLTVWAQDAAGHELLLDSRDLIQRTILVSGRWEPNATELLESLLRPGDSVLDVGANIGYFALLGRSLVGDEGYVRAFEASFDLSMRLRANLVRNGVPESVAVHVAVVDGVERVDVLEGPLRNRGVTRVVTPSAGGTLGGTHAGGRPSRLPTTVRGVSLDALVPDLPRDRPLIVKMDIEGAEEAAAEGLERLLEAGPEDVAVLVECTPRALLWNSGRGVGDSAPRGEHWLFAMADRMGLEVFVVPNGYRLSDLYPTDAEQPRRVTVAERGQRDYLAVRGAKMVSRMHVDGRA